MNRPILFVIILTLIFICTAALTSCNASSGKSPATPKTIPPPPFSSSQSSETIPQIQAFDISPNIIRRNLNQKATLHWNVSGATRIIIGGMGDVPSAGTTVINPPVSMVITLTASNMHGSVSQSRTLTVKP